MKSIKKLIVMCTAGCLALLTVACGGGVADAELQTLRMFHVVPLVWVCHPDPLGIRICCLQQHGSEPK